MGNMLIDQWVSRHAVPMIRVGIASGGGCMSGLPSLICPGRSSRKEAHFAPIAMISIADDQRRGWKMARAHSFRDAAEQLQAARRIAKSKLWILPARRHTG